MHKISTLYVLFFAALSMIGCREDSSHPTEKKRIPIEALVPEIIEKIKQDYVEEVKEDKIIEGALNGIFSSLDPYSAYLGEKEYQALTEVTKGEFGGVGLEILVDKGVVKVIAAIDETPAYKAGVRAGDTITHINGKEVHKLSPAETLREIPGAPGTEITLTIARPDKEPFVVKLIRALIKINPIKFQVKDNIAYLRLPSFNENAVNKMRDVLTEVKSTSKVQGLILDLRDNPGGTLEQAVAVCNCFLENGIIVDIKGRNSSYNQTIYAKGQDLIRGVPMAVLINKGSASASEIVAGALKDHKRAILLGVTSFGKGSVQTVFSLPGYGAIKLTTACFFTPKGTAIQMKGIEPDIVVKEEEIKTEDAKKVKQTTPLNSVDYQMQRAIDLLRGLSVFQMRGSVRGQ